MADAPGTMHDDADSNRRLANVELSDEDVLLMAEASGDATFFDQFAGESRVDVVDVRSRCRYPQSRCSCMTEEQWQNGFDQRSDTNLLEAGRGGDGAYCR